jgi:hypothetical protein
MRQFNLFSLIFSNALYVVGIIFSTKLIWNLFWIIESSNNSFDFSAILTLVSRFILILILLFVMYTAWSLFKEGKFKESSLVTLLPVGLYALSWVIMDYFARGS